MSNRKPFFIYFLLAFVLYTAIIVVIQVNKEKRHQTEIQKNILQVYAQFVENYLQKKQDTLTALQYLPSNIRVSIIDEEGNLCFDNKLKENITNHLDRPEINAARINGSGSAIRKSTSNHIDYLYFAKESASKGYIRVALPQIIRWNDFFQWDNIALQAAIVLFFALLTAWVYQSDKFRKVMQILKQFATSIEEGNVDYTAVKFPDTTSGEIGSKIISIYKQLEQSKREIEKVNDRNKKLKYELTNNIAHELKTPVSSIRGYLEILLGEKPIETEKVRYFLERSYAQTLRLSDLINDVALITKLEESTELFPKEKIGIKAIAQEAVIELESALGGKHINLENNLSEEMFIAGNYKLIYCIFRNLIENAIMHAGENITVAMENYKQDEEYFYLRFYDTGCGVKHEYLYRIFERFQRIDEGRNRQKGGTGLGLSIVKHAVLFHHGTISAQNRPEGGLEFCFTLKKK
jgi:signal transduction histidine kinase